MIKNKFKFFKNKKGIELSVNFVVGLILAMALFGVGLTIFGKFFFQAEEMKSNLNIQTRKELEQIMMSSSEQVIIYPSKLTIPKGNSDIFGVGVLNIGQSTITFTIGTQLINCYDRGGNTISCDLDAITSIQQLKSRTLEPNKREIVEIPVRVKQDTGSGKYALEVTVSGISNHIVYIDVP